MCIYIFIINILVCVRACVSVCVCVHDPLDLNIAEDIWQLLTKNSPKNVYFNVILSPKQ